VSDHAGPGSSELAVIVRGLEKAYGGTAAVAGIDLEVARGEIFALLGPNGAGKTTTMEILEGYRARDRGEVSVPGHDPGRERAALKSRIGIVLQATGIEAYLTVVETVSMYAELYPRPLGVDEVIEIVGLTSKRDERVIHLSGGQQRRLEMAIAFVGDPDLVFLDEPTTGFDPSARHEAWDLVKRFAALGKTVLLTTHYMDEARFLADRVAVISAGRIVAEGAPAALESGSRARTRLHCRLVPPMLPPNDLGRPAEDGTLEVELDDVLPTLHRLLHWAEEHGVEL